MASRDAPAICAIIVASVSLLASASPVAARDAEANRLWIEAVYREVYRGDLDGAREKYAAFLEQHADHERAAEALLRLALCHEKQGDIASARARAEEVVSRFPRRASVRSRAEALLGRLAEESLRAERERERQAFLRENEALRLQIAALYEQIERARSVQKEDERDEARRKEEIEKLRNRIDSLTEEAEQLRKRLGDQGGEGGGEENLSPEEILNRLEQEAAVKEQERRFLAEHYFRAGQKLQADERFEEALENYRRCLRLYDGHEKAREALRMVGAILGDRKSGPLDILSQLEIRKEVRLHQAKADLANTFRQAFETYRLGAFEASNKLFRRALDILVRDLPADPEFDRQKELAARYIRQCQANMRDPSAAPPVSIEVRLRAVSLSAEAIAKLKDDLGLTFHHEPGTTNNLAWAVVAKASWAETLTRLREDGHGQLDRAVLLAAGSRVTIGVPEKGSSDAAGVTLSIRLLSTGDDGSEIEISGDVRTPVDPDLVLPGANLHGLSIQSGHARATLKPGTGALFAGLANPTPGAEGETALVLILEVAG